MLQIIWGVLIMTCVSAAWVGATHLLKSTFQTVQMIQVTEPPVVSTSAPHALLPPAANGSSTTVATPTTDQVNEFSICATLTFLEALERSGLATKTGTK